MSFQVSHNVHVCHWKLLVVVPLDLRCHRRSAMAELERNTDESVRLHQVLLEVARDFFNAQKDEHDDGDVVEYHGNNSLPFLHRTRKSFQERYPQLKDAARHTFTDILQWMHKGGVWRAFLVTAVGVVLLLGLAGLSAFILFFLSATLNAIVIGFLGSVASVGAISTLFFSSLIVIYIGAVVVAVASISTITFLCVGCASTVAGWIGFFWLVWQGLKKGIDICKTSVFMLIATLTTIAWQVSGPMRKSACKTLYKGNTSRLLHQTPKSISNCAVVRYFSTDK
ncbi:hypothetical protein GOP47_0021595 [Adiantum capillus-veneris]|uniref:Transmembrane protein n=1 Tax=Adiantum capillus-veneris TaxID=13818 RepID=A0A9D4U8P7_ADICA|nr:hypothetical protein GOP47_0021595 [Adiantum capillus-veneris]